MSDYAYADDAERIEHLVRMRHDAERNAETWRTMLRLAQEVALAALNYATYEDLRGEPCTVCCPAEPADYLAARDRLADALDAWEDPGRVT